MIIVRLGLAKVIKIACLNVESWTWGEKTQYQAVLDLFEKVKSFFINSLSQQKSCQGLSVILKTIFPESPHVSKHLSGTSKAFMV